MTTIPPSPISKYFDLSNGVSSYSPDSGCLRCLNPSVPKKNLLLPHQILTIMFITHLISGVIIIIYFIIYYLYTTHFTILSGISYVLTNIFIITIVSHLI